MEVRGNLLKDWQSSQVCQVYEVHRRHLKGSWLTHGEPPWFTPKIGSFDWVITYLGKMLREIHWVFLRSFEFSRVSYRPDQTVNPRMTFSSKSWSLPHRSRCYYQGCKIRGKWYFCRCFTWVFDIMIYRVWGGRFLVQHNSHSQNSCRDDVIAQTNQCRW